MNLYFSCMILFIFPCTEKLEKLCIEMKYWDCTFIQFNQINLNQKDVEPETVEITQINQTIF